MAAINTIITTDTLREHAPGVDGSLVESTIKPYLRPAHKTVAAIIGIAVFNKVANMEASLPLRESLCAAVANRLMYDYKLFETIQKRQTKQADTYKYELQAMQETYLGFYYDALDSLIQELNSEPLLVPEWKATTAFRTLSELLIPSADDFTNFYGIDGSDYFFWSTIFLQRKVMDQYLSGISIDELDDELLRRVKGVVAMLTVAFALRQFDVSMLPKSLRNPTQDGASRTGSSEQDAMYKLSNMLMDGGEKEFARIVFELNKPSEGADVVSTSNMNTMEQKFYLLS